MPGLDSCFLWSAQGLAAKFAGDLWQVQNIGKVKVKGTGFNRIKPRDTKGILKDIRYEVNERRGEKKPNQMKLVCLGQGQMSQIYKEGTRE